MKKLTNDIEITEFLIQEIQNPTLLYIYPFQHDKFQYSGICEILKKMSYNSIITLLQQYNFYTDYIQPNVFEHLEGYLFQPFQIAPRVEFLQNLLKDLQKTL